MQCCMLQIVLPPLLQRSQNGAFHRPFATQNKLHKGKDGACRHKKVSINIVNIRLGCTLLIGVIEMGVQITPTLETLEHA